MNIEFDTPSFRPRTYEGEHIEYVLYELDDSGEEIDSVGVSRKNADAAKRAAEKAVTAHPDKHFHCVAILCEEGGRMLDSEVVWSTDQNESKGADETIEYEKGHKNSRGEDAPWVIRDHKGGKVRASFANKEDAEAHLDRMKHYSKSEVADSAGFSQYVKNLLDAAFDKFDDATWGRLVKGYDFGDDFENGRSVDAALANMKGWALATEKAQKSEALFNKQDLERIALDGHKNAVNAAMDASGAKNFTIDIQQNAENIDILPKSLDGKDFDVNWRILPNVSRIVQYSMGNSGDSNIEREIPFKDDADIEAIFTDEFKDLDEVIEGGKAEDAKSEAVINRITMTDARKKCTSLQKAGKLAGCLDEVSAAIALVQNALANGSPEVKNNSLNAVEKKIVARAVLAEIVSNFGFQPEDLR